MAILIIGDTGITTAAKKHTLRRSSFYNSSEAPLACMCILTRLCPHVYVNYENFFKESKI